MSGPRLLVAVVDRDLADSVVRAAIRAGAQAATVLLGRGTDAQEHMGLSGLALHSEKEIVVTVVEARIAGSVVRAMAGASPDQGGGAGYIATMAVARVVGLLEAIEMRGEGR